MPSKYSSIQRSEFKRPYDIHPAWRGIGFLLIIISLGMSWVGMLVLKELGRQQGWPIMAALGYNLRLPNFFYQTPGLSILANALYNIPDLPATLFFFFGVLLVISGVLSLFYAILYRMFGPSRYTEMDMPAPKVNTRRYTR